ncbi:MAG: hypothetical protein DRO93_06825 [Candidatus Thorarchaeota archaeon]|nr:MAG: hypothetical protein DRO93_06825 [Candidatus Thorarchaeota archaeon]
MTRPLLSRSRIVELVEPHLLLIVTLIGGLVFWALVFQHATTTFAGERPLRATWTGGGDLSFLGLPFTYDWEGWADYDYYYISWADQFLNGVTPYTAEFDAIEVQGEIYNTPFFLPPLYLYLCAVGRLLPIQPYGIALLIAAFGYLTAIPLYGIVRYLSDDELTAVVAALTYLFNPIVLYHTLFNWLNPAPFTFFAVLGFYLLMRNHRYAGSLSFVTAFFFKQMAVFFALPLIAYLVKRPPFSHGATPESTGNDGDAEEGRRPPSDDLDLKSFAKVTVVVLVYAALLSIPYIFDPYNYLFRIFVRPGITHLEDLTTVPPRYVPVTIVVPFIVVGAPTWLLETIDLLAYTSVLLVIGIMPPMAMMLYEVKDDAQLRRYWRRILLFTLIMLLLAHALSPRGIYKYYCVTLVPFIVILSVSRMCGSDNESVEMTPLMLITPFVWSIAVLFLPRESLPLLLLMTAAAYALHHKVGNMFSALGRPLALFRKTLSHDEKKPTSPAELVTRSSTPRVPSSSS